MPTTIKFEKPIVWHEKHVSEVVLKEPTGQTFIDLGEPRLVVSSRSGSVYWAEMPDTIKAYLDRCIDHEGGSPLLAQLSLADAKKVKAALFDFFESAAREWHTGQRPVIPSRCSG